MQFVVINYSVFVIWVVTGNAIDIRDLSDRCTKGRIIHTYLTSGKEYSDISITLIASESHLNCTLVYNVKYDSYVMVVVEFLDRDPFKKQCTDDANVTFMVRCDADNFYCKKAEVECIYGYKLYCASSVTRCDGHINCGVSNKYDEEGKRCEGSIFTPMVIIMSLIMVIISVFLIVAFSVVLLPKRKETFIYKLDETMTPFDVGDASDAGHKFEIETKIIYSNIEYQVNNRLNAYSDDDDEDDIDDDNEDDDRIRRRWRKIRIA